MPETYKKQLGAQSYKNYTQEHLDNAVNAIKSKKMTLQEASERFVYSYMHF